jgi:hypothetical protein
MPRVKADREGSMEPSATVKVEKTIKNAPVEDGLDEYVSNRGRKQVETPIDDQVGGEEDKVAKFLADHTVKIHVDRVSPREWKGKQISGMVDEYVPPTTVEEVETDLRNRFGGGRYRIRVLKNGRFLAARGVHVYGDPKLPEEDFEPDMDEAFPGLRGHMPPGGDPREFMMPPPGDDDITQLRKEIEKEKLKKALEEVKTNGRPKDAPDPETVRREAEERIRREMRMEREVSDVKNEMDRKLDHFMGSMKELLRSQKETDPGRDSDVVALDNKVERIKTEIMGEVKSTFAEMKSVLKDVTAVKQEKPDNTPELFKAIIAGFTAMNSSGESKLKALSDAEKIKAETLLTSMKEINEANAKVAQAQTEKLVAMLESSKDGGGIGSVAKSVSAVRDIAESIGWTPGGGAGEPEEPKDIQTRVLMMVEKALPSLLAAQKAKANQEGQQGPSKEEIDAAIAQQAQIAARQLAPAIAHKFALKRAEEEAARNAQIEEEKNRREEIEKQLGDTAPNPAEPSKPEIVSVPQQTPPPPPPQPVIDVPPPETKTEEEPKPVEEPPKEPVAETVTASSSKENVEVKINKKDEVSKEAVVDTDVEKVKRVNDCMGRLLAEAAIRPRSPEWNDYAFDNLPGDVLDKLVLATDAEGVLTAVESYCDPLLIERFKDTFRNDERGIEWFVRCLNDMKLWYAEDESGESGEEEEEA